jgi:hypothetical protein
LLVPLAMYVPFARSDYYGTSATTRRHRRTTHLPTTAEGGSDGSLPTFITVRSTGEAASSTPAASPTPTPQSFSVASPPASKDRLRSRRPWGAACAAFRPSSVRFEPVEQLRGFRHWFLASTFRSRLPSPGHLTVLARHGFVRAAPTPARVSATRLPSAFPTLLRQRRRRGLAPPPEMVTPRGAPRSCSTSTCPVGSGRP